MDALYFILSFIFSFYLRSVVCVNYTDIVSTQYGDVKGLEVPGVGQVYYGLPYAAPPIGDLRFKKPVKPAAWSGVRDAAHLQAFCMQDKDVNELQNRNMSEDCLYVNIYIPDSESRSLPVMAWIHGGGFVSGNPEFDGYTSGVKLAVKGGVIVVHITYRLGVLGLLPFDHKDTDMNVALYDQQAALQWIKDNIVGFGGDPNQITIFGVSAGAMSVGFQVLSPLNKGLFQRAISQSGVAGIRLGIKEQQEYFKITYALGQGCSISDTDTIIKCLQAKDAESLQKLNNYFPSPVIDGEFIPESPGKMFKKGNYNKVPYMFSINSEDGTLFINTIKGADIFTNGMADNIVDVYMNLIIDRSVHVNPELNPLAKQLAKSYYKFDESDPFVRLRGILDLAKHTSFTYPTMVNAATITDQGGDVYLMQFSQGTLISYRPSPIDIGVAHTDDLSLVFGNFLTPIPGTGITEKDLQDLSDDVIETWTSFAKGEVPHFTDRDNNIVELPKYNTAERPYLDWTVNMTEKNIKNKYEPLVESLWMNLLPTLYESTKCQQCTEDKPENGECISGNEAFGFLGMTEDAYKAVMVFLIALSILLFVMLVFACIAGLRYRAKSKNLEELRVL
jgi:carboxylesterase type B